MNNSVNRSTHTVFPLLLFLALLCFSAAHLCAQENGLPPQPPNEAERNTANQGDNLVRALGLTPEQVGKIRMIREQNQEERRLAGERLRNAQRALDEAIYSENVSEAMIEERAREMASAQAAMVRLRALTELSIRRVLTPEQLTTLRALRLRQAQQRRLGRGLNLQRPLRGNRPRNTGDGPPLPRDRFRQRENPPAQQNNNSNPSLNAPRERRNDTLRRARP